LKLKLNPWKDRYVIASGLSVWKHTSFLRGVDALLIDMVEDPQKASFLFDRFTATYGEFFRRMLREAGDLIDALPMADDLGKWTSYEPGTVREVYRPLYRTDGEPGTPIREETVISFLRKHPPFDLLFDRLWNRCLGSPATISDGSFRGKATVWEPSGVAAEEVLQYYGIFSGLFTPTEAAVITCCYALFLGGVVYRTLTWGKLLQVIRETLSSSVVIGFIVASISVMGYVLAREQIPQKIAEFVMRNTSSPLVFMLSFNLLLLLLGTVIETMAILLLVVPIFVPIAASLGIDPVHFGVVVVMNMMIGILSPPMGVSLFVVSKVGNIPFPLLAKSILPFIVPLFIVLLLLIFFPPLVMFIPNLIK